MTYAQFNSQAAGDPQLGQTVYAVCAACHGSNGEGNVALNAPRLAGQQDWYVRRQISYYKQGIRGTHAGDLYGSQMAPMAAVLATDASVDNVAAYIQTLPDVPAAVTVTGDEYGHQMTSMVQALGDDEAINDVVAYINTL